MPSIANHQSAKTVKLLLVGDSGAGKSGALASLAAEGYNLRVIDLDNGLDVLRSYLTKPDSPYLKRDPTCASRVNYVTLTDSMKNLNGRLIPTKATVWQKTMNLLTEWKDGDTNLGKLLDWTPQDVLVIDSLSMLATAALNFHLSMNGALAAVRTQNEARRDIGVAQQLLRDLLALLYDESVKCNIIVTSHITFVSETGTSPNAEGAAGVAQGYPSAIGRALSPHIPRYFNNMLIARTIGSGPQARHKIFTTAQNVAGQVINAKSASPLGVANEYSLDWGLAEYFKAVRA